MKLLFVSCLLPYPDVTHGGGVDLFHLIASLATRHEVSLVSIVSEDEIGHVAEIAPYCVAVRTVAPAWSLRQKLRQGWRGLRTNPFMLGRRARAEMRAHIRQVVAGFVPDVVQFEWTETGTYLDAIPSGEAIRVLDEVDVSYRPLAHLAEQRSAWWQVGYARWRSRRARVSELALCRRFDAVLTRSEHDRQVLLAQDPGLYVAVVQPWTHVAQFAGVTAQERARGRLLFVGAMDRNENCEAVLYFYHHVFPLVRRRCPAVELWIVGANPQQRVVRLGRDPAVVVTGYVEDLRASYATCDVFVAPLRVPGGVFNKIVDAMAAGRPVVTTSLGNEGIGAPAGTAVCIADEPAQFAAHVEALLQDEALWTQIATAGRRHVQRTYDWERNVTRLEGLYDRLRFQRERHRG